MHFSISLEESVNCRNYSDVLSLWAIYYNFYSNTIVLNLCILGILKQSDINFMQLDYCTVYAFFGHTISTTFV